jgi:hypothetical protein
MIPELDRVLEPAYLDGIAEVGPDELRAMRRWCTDLENGVSYVRRLVQGRIDLLADEVKARAAGRGGDLADLVNRLPELLSDKVRSPVPGRAEQELDPPESVVAPLTAALDDVVGPSILAHLATLDDVELSAAVLALGDFEESLSRNRRALHATIDSLNDELGRRISAGEMPPASS